jgi:hypothetical protein
LIPIALAAAAAVGLWFVLSPADERADAPDEAVDADSARAVVPAAAPAPPPLAPQPNAAHRSTLAAPAAPAGPKVVGPHPEDPHEPGMRPHPMDEARERIDAENRLILLLNEAMSFRNVKEMRELIVAYRQLDPTDRDASQAGYAVIADCIERPGEASLAAAHQFYDTQRHSSLRRFVRRICFENSN